MSITEFEKRRRNAEKRERAINNSRSLVKNKRQQTEEETE
jgi:hypothetical protein